MILSEHYTHPKLDWNLINAARSDQALRMDALRHIRSVTHLNMCDAKVFLDSPDLYFDPRLGTRPLTLEEEVHSLKRENRELEAKIHTLNIQIAILSAERDVYKDQLYYLLKRNSSP